MRPPPLTALSLALPVVAGLCAGALHAQGRTAAPLLASPASARAAAMGDAASATVRGDSSSADAAVLFYNPALIAGVRGTAASLSAERGVGSAALGTLAAAHALGRVVVAAGALTLDYPDAEELAPDGAGGAGVPTGARVDAHDLVAGVGAATSMGPLRAGALAAYVGQWLPGTSGATVAVDVGLAAIVRQAAWGTLALGVAAQHLGPGLRTGSQRAPLPRAWRAGATLADVRLARARWAAVAELVARQDGAARPRGGVEGAWQLGGVGLAARAGWTGAAAGDLARPLTAGAGIRRGHLWVDYAWRGVTTVGDAHRVGVRWQR